MPGNKEFFYTRHYNNNSNNNNYHRELSFKFNEYIQKTIRSPALYADVLTLSFYI